MIRSWHFVGTLALALTACGGGGTESASPACEERGKNAGGLIDVGGNVVFHSMNRLASETSGKPIEYDDLLVEVVDLEILASGAAAEPLAQAGLVTDGCAGSGASPCAFCFVDTKIAEGQSGLGAVIRDGRTSGALWLTAVTGIATGEELSDLQAAGTALDPRSSFAVTRDALDTVLTSLTGLDGAELLARGVIFGLVYSNTRSSGERGTPVVGATVTPSSDDVIIVYPNNNFSATAAETTNQGAFLAIPKAAGALQTVTFTVTPPAGESHTWDAAHLGVFTPGAIYYHLMFAAE